VRDSIFTPGPDAIAAASLNGSRVIKRLTPGAPGTRRLQQHYREGLVCVRYREDPVRGMRYTTVEIIVDQRQFAAKEDLIHLAHNETDLRRQIMAAGGHWDGKLKLWRVAKHATRALGLQKRVTKRAQ
jgi:hypothetical protein